MKLLKLRFVSYNEKLLQKNLKTLVNELKSKGYSVTWVSLPKKSKLYTVIKSPFVNKKSREQFKLEESSKLILLKGSNLFEIIEILKRRNLEGIAFKITLKGR